MKPRTFVALLCGAALLAAAAVPVAGAPANSPSGAEPDIAGNNLSYPAVWAEGNALNLQGTMEQSSLAGAYATMGGSNWYEQHDSLNVWQAENAGGVAGTPVDIEYIDWADALESMDWALGSKVRVEVVLYHSAAMHGYPMTWLYGSGTSEMWGTKEGECFAWDASVPPACTKHYGILTAGNYATVYSQAGRLTIQKIADSATGTPPSDIVWNSASQKWTSGSISLPDPAFSHDVSETYSTGTKPYQRFGAEINLPGKAIYGSLWDTKVVSDGVGLYRLTFSLDPAHSPNAVFLGTTGITPPSDDLLKDPLAVPGETGEIANTPVVRADLNLTYIDVGLVSSKGGSGKPK